MDRYATKVDVVVINTPMSIGARLQEFVTYLGKSVNQVADACSINRATLHKALRSGKGMHSDTIVAVLKTFRELSADWLLLGDGPMIRNAQDNQSRQPISSGLQEVEPLSRAEVLALRSLLRDQKRATPPEKKKAG